MNNPELNVPGHQVIYLVLPEGEKMPELNFLSKIFTPKNHGRETEETDDEDDSKTEPDMAECPGHKAMLYFLEVLMNSNGPLSISQMAGRFGSKTFSSEMRQAAGGNEAGLRKFLLKYPSLFSVNGNLVSLNDSGSSPSFMPDSSSSSTSSTPISTPSRTMTDLSLETEAVLYFQNRLAKKEEKWCQIKSLAGHLSQSSMDVRTCVGPQNEFKKFLLKHPHVFEVQGELVGLRDSFSSVAYSKKDAFNKPPVRPKNLKFAQRSHSNPITPLPKTPSMTPTPTTPNPISNKPAPITMTANEYKAVMYIKTIIEKKGKIKLHNLTGHFSQAQEGVRNTIGWTKMELEEFLKKNANMFTIDEEEYVGIKKAQKLHVIITGSRPQGGQSVQTLTNRRGKIFHVAKLWGIIDLGKHEHVFFDRSIYHKDCDDLQRDFKINDILNFNAILAPKDSRAKWKATQIWRDGESGQDAGRSVTFGDSSGAISPSLSIEEEISRLLPNDFDPAEIMKHMKDDPFGDATPSGTGSVPIWNNNSPKDRSKIRSTSDLPEISPSISMVPENYFMYASSMEDIQNALPDYVVVPDPSDVVSPARRKSFSNNRDVVQNGDSEPRFCDVGCQTISTGEVLATQLYHEGLVNDKEKLESKMSDSQSDGESQ